MPVVVVKANSYGLFATVLKCVIGGVITHKQIEIWCVQAGKQIAISVD